MINMTRHQELCDKIEALVREYGDVIHDSALDDEICEHGSPPDWNHPMAVQHWALVLTVDDQNPSSDKRGYWTFAVLPTAQRPYITRGLLEEFMDGFLS